MYASRAGDAPALKPVGPVALVDAPGGKAVRLDGQGYLEAPVYPRLVLHGSYTVEAWIRPGKQRMLALWRRGA